MGLSRLLGLAKLHSVLDAIRALENMDSTDRDLVCNEIKDLVVIAEEGGQHARGELLNSLLGYLETGGASR